jgi:hypothetical protein
LRSRARDRSGGSDHIQFIDRKIPIEAVARYIQDLVEPGVVARAGGDSGR